MLNPWPIRTKLLQTIKVQLFKHRYLHVWDTFCLSPAAAASPWFVTLLHSICSNNPVPVRYTHRNTRRLYYFASRWVRLSAVTSLYPPCSLADKPKTKKNTLICSIMSLRSGKSCTQKHACPRLSNSRLTFLSLWTVSHALVSSLKPVNRLVLAPCTRTCRFAHPIEWKNNVNLPFLFYRRYSKEDNSPS